MFVQINDAYAALRRRLERRRPPACPRYVRKPKIAGRRIYARPGGAHRASSTRPSYSHPACRARRAVRAALTTSRVRRAARTALPSMPTRRHRPATRSHDDSPARDMRAIGRAVVRQIPTTVNLAVRAWLADARHGARSHRHPDAPHRRDHVYLPNIGWCWVTDEHPKVVI
jgi:hypothetical protein